jgi:hypothetical protein
MTVWSLNNQLETMWKEAVVDYPGIYMKGLMKTKGIEN